MGKRYKKGNCGRKKNKIGKSYINREKQLNNLLNTFADNLFSDDFDKYDFEDYKKMNRLRLDIKALFDIQGKEVHHNGRRRRNIYYSQLSRFKRIYTYWKKQTYLVYVILRYGLPVSCLDSLIYYDWYGVYIR